MGTRLVALQGPLAGQTFPLPPLLATIGADPLSDITWPDEALAAQHALLRWDGQRHILEDLGSAGGTSINGQRMTDSQALQPGDEVEIGASLFRYEVSRPSREPSPVSAPPVAEAAPAPVLHATGQGERLGSFPLVPLVALALAMAAVLLWLAPALRDRAAASPTITVSAPTAQSFPSPTLGPALEPTWTPEPENTPRYYPVPALLSPPQDAQGTTHELQWSWQGALGLDEWYSVWVWRSDASPHSLAWTKEPRMEVGAGLAPGAYHWQVVVVQGVMQGQHQRDLSAPSEIRRFTIPPLTATLTPRPTGTNTATPAPTQTATSTRTPQPIALVIVAGQVYDARFGPAAPLANAEIRIYAADQRAIVRSGASGQYRAEFRLRSESSGQPLDLLAIAPGYEPGVAHLTLGSYLPETTQVTTVNLALIPSSTPTATWLPPIPTLTPTATPTKTPPLTP